MNKPRIYIFVVISIAAILFVVWLMKSEEKENVKGSSFEKKTEQLLGKSSDSAFAFKKFAEDFNSHKAQNINNYIDPKLGMVMYYHDGPYPIIEMLSEIGSEIDWINDDIFTNVEFNGSPNYLGDFEFSKTGFFVKENKGKFSLKDFDNSYTSHPDSFFKENKKLETLCNFSATGISKDQKRLFEFYFNFNDHKLTLLGLSVENVSDIMFGNPNVKSIPFNNKNDIEDYLKNQKIFVDKEQNAHIDFNKKELTYYDYPNENPFVFEYFEIGDIEEDSDKIKSARIIFYPNKLNKEDGFIAFFSNKGSFVVAPMGVRPPYFYEPVSSNK